MEKEEFMSKLNKLIAERPKGLSCLCITGGFTKDGGFFLGKNMDVEGKDILWMLGGAMVTNSSFKEAVFKIVESYSIIKENIE